MGLVVRNCVPLGAAGSTGETAVSEGAEGLLGVGMAAKRGGTPGLEGAESSVSAETLLATETRDQKGTVSGMKPQEHAKKPARTKRHKRTRTWTQGGDVQPRTTPETDSTQTRDVHRTRLRRVRRRSRRGS
jgi:hypothetical protein